MEEKQVSKGEKGQRDQRPRDPLEHPGLGVLAVPGVSSQHEGPRQNDLRGGNHDGHAPIVEALHFPRRDAGTQDTIDRGNTHQGLGKARSSHKQPGEKHRDKFKFRNGLPQGGPHLSPLLSHFSWGREKQTHSCVSWLPFLSLFPLVNNLVGMRSVGAIAPYALQTLVFVAYHIGVECLEHRDLLVGETILLP
jgi:hypothetical protein